MTLLTPRKRLARLPRGITAYWPLDAATCEFGSGQVRPRDLIGNNYGADAKSMGAAGGPPYDGDGIGYKFNATTNTYLVTNSDPLLGGGLTATTVMCWVNYNSYTSSDGAGQGPRLLAFGTTLKVLVDDGASTGSLLAGAIFTENAGGTNLGTTASACPLGRWTHVAVTYVSGAPAAIYINGALVAATGVAGGGFSGSVNSGNIGCRDALARVMDGKVAHAMVCQGTVLTAGEIADLYSSFFVAEEIMPAMFLPAAGGSFLAAWARGSNLPVLGTGTY